MSDKEARMHATSEWLMEFSLLWAVFPVLDQMIGNAPVGAGMIAISLGISAVTFFGGILLRKGEQE